MRGTLSFLERQARRANGSSWRRGALAVSLVVLLGGCGASSNEADSDSANLETPGAGGFAGSFSGGAGGTSAAGSAGAAGTAGAAGQGGSTPLSISGYFDLHLNAVDASLPTGPGDVTSPTKTTPFRLDLPEKPAKGAWQAVLTPRWGKPATFTVTQSDDGLLLEGNATVAQASQSGTAVNDVWQSFRLPLVGKKIAGTVTAAGQEDVFSGDLGWSGKLAGKGSVTADSTAPEARPTQLAGFGPDGTQLPWESVQVALAEPLSSSQLLALLSLSKKGEAPLPVAWAPGATVAEAGGGVSQLTGQFQSWDSLPGDAILHLADGYEDPAKNSGAGFEHGFGLLTVPAPQGSSLVMSKASLVSWGDASLASSEDGCEGSSCLAFGPFPNRTCGLDGSGVAMRLSATNSKGNKSSSLKIRLRVFQSGDALAPDQPPYQGNLTPVSLQVARPGKEPAQLDINALPSSDLGPDVGDLRFGSSWVTLSFDLPTGSGDVGVALRAGSLGAHAACAAGVAASAVKTRVLISSVSVELSVYVWLL
jgi:hypothetical protein